MRLNDVKQRFKSDLETTKQVKGSNSFVAPYPHYSYKLDLMLFSALKNQEIAPQAVLCIDIVAKYSVLVPVKSKTKR